MAENLESKSVGSVSGTNLAGNVMMNAGNAMTGPNAQPVPMSNAEKAKTRMNAAFSNAYVEDDARYNKLTSFNASHHGKNFERYYAHPKFKNLGFSPWRDNEAFYNQNSSLWDDAFRGVKATGQLMGLAFTETAANWGSLFSMKPNVEAADKMERIMSVGSSSRDGIGAKLINFGVNAGYTLGTVGEIIAEEALLWGVTAGLTASGVGIPAAAGTGAVATARTAYNITRLSKAFKGLSDTFRAAKKIETARDIFNSAKGIGKAADYLLPFQNTRELLTKAGRAGAKWDTLDNMAKVSKGFGSFYKDLVQINAVTSEAKLEGGFAQNDVVNRLYEDFRKQNGRDPNEGEASAIYNQAREAGYLSAQMNSVGIYVSNKILLDRLFKGIPGMGRLDDVARRKVKGNLVYTGNWAKKDGVWEAVSGVKKFGKSGYYKQTFNPKNLAKGSLGYLSANLMEGTQEVYQEAIAKGITDYYVETFNQPSRAGNAEFYAKMKGGLASQFSEQGLETFLSGFLMAGPVTAVQSAFYKGIDYARIGQLKLKDKQFKADPKNAGKPSPYEAQLNQEKEFTGKVVNALNDITADPTKYFSAIERNAKVQADLARLGEQAALDGDTHAAISNRDESLVEHMITLLDAGKFDIFEDQIKSLKSLPKEDLQEAFDQDPTVEGNPVADRMDTVLKRMNQIREVYDAYQNMENPFQLRQDPIGYMAFEQGKHVMMRNDITYNRLGERMTSVYDTFVNDLPFASANLNDFSVLFSVGTTMEMVTLAASQTGMPNYLVAGGMANEIDILGREIENLRGLGTAEDSKKADDLVEKRNSLQSLNRLVQSYTSMYKVTQSPTQTDEQYENNLKSLQESEEILKKAYIDHLMILGKQNNQTVLLPSVEASFQKYADYWKLAVDKSSVANAINFLNDPNNFRSSVERLQNAMTEASRQRSENLEKALAAFKEKFLTNAFFNELFEKHNVFVSPDEAEAFVDSNIIPSEFFDADTMEPVPTDSDKYKEILKLVDKYDEIFFEESGKRLQRPIVQGEGVARLAGYNTETGEAVEQFFGDKDPEDKRTIKQLAEEFGFSSVEPLAVDAKKVLEAVIKSKHASKQQKKLAQAMLSFMRPGMMVNFKVDHHTNSTYDPVNGVIVDPRYSAEGFITGTVPIEFSILNGLMQQIVSDSLSDMEFNSRVTEIREQLIAELPEIDRAYFAYALEDNQQFVADVMTNPDLQQAMTKIEYAGDLTAQSPEARTLWQTFMDAVVEMLSKIFPGRTKTLYQEAVNVITNKLVQPPTADAPVLNEELTEEEEPDIPVTGTLDPELETRLKTKFDEIMAAMPEADRNAISYESWKMSDYTALSIINAYNAEQIKKKAGEKELGKGVALTEAEKKRRITALGYTVSELNQMSAEQVNNIIQNNLKKRIKTLLPDQGKLVEKEIPFDQYLRFQDYIEEVISDAVIKLNAKTFDLTDEGYIEVDALGQPIPGTLHKRVSNVVKDKFDGSKEATDRGTIIDNLLRDFISNEIGDINAFKERYNTYKAKYSSAGAFSDQMLDDLFDKFRTINIILKERGIKIISNIPTLYGKLGNEQVAGTIDLFAYDRTGKVYIIDLKTSSQDRRLQYKLEEKLESLFGKEYNEVKALIKASENDNNLALDRSTGETKEKLRQIADNPEFAPLITNKGKMPVYFYKEQDALQQNAYKELFKQVTGIEVDGIIIFPIKTAKTGKVYTKADFQKEGNKHTMNVKTFDIHEVLGLENTVESYPENPLSPENKNQFLGTPLPEEKPAPVPTDTKGEPAVLEGAKSTEDVGTQTQLGFEEFTLNVGDRVKINTPKDGEGVIKEDRGDKVLLEDGRQVMKKNLTKLDVPETAQVETNVAEKYRGKIIYATPTTESVEMLEGFKGIVYGPTLYIKAVIGDFDNDTLERIKAIQSGEIQADQWVKDNAEKLVKTLETGISAKTDLLTFQGAIMAIIKSTPDQLADPALKSRLKAIMKKAWDNTMVMAQVEAAKGYTVVFDQNAAAERPEIDLALIDNTSVKVKKKNGALNKSYSDAIAKIPANKKTEISGKGLLNVLSGKLNENYVIPEDIANFNESLASSTPRSLKELVVNMETLSKLGLLESVLASQNITLQGARNLVFKRRKELAGRLDITDTVLQVIGSTPIAVEYEMNGKRLPGIVKSNNGIEIEIVPFQPNIPMEDLFKQSEIVKFSSKEVPFNVFIVSTQKPVTVDPEVKAQSDAANQQNVNDFANNSEALKQAMESDERTSSEFGNDFLDRIKCI